MILRRLFQFGTGINITLFVAIAFGLLVWFAGPFLPLGESTPYASVLSRLITIAIIMLLALTTILLIIMRRAKREKQMAEDIVESVDDAEDEDLHNLPPQHQPGIDAARSIVHALDNDGRPRRRRRA